MNKIESHLWYRSNQYLIFKIPQVLNNAMNSPELNPIFYIVIFIINLHGVRRFDSISRPLLVALFKASDIHLYIIFKDG